MQHISSQSTYLWQNIRPLFTHPRQTIQGLASSIFASLAQASRKELGLVTCGIITAGVITALVIKIRSLARQNASLVRIFQSTSDTLRTTYQTLCLINRGSLSRGFAIRLARDTRNLPEKLQKTLAAAQTDLSTEKLVPQLKEEVALAQEFEPIVLEEWGHLQQQLGSIREESTQRERQLAALTAQFREVLIASGKIRAESEHFSAFQLAPILLAERADLQDRLSAATEETTRLQGELLTATPAHLAAERDNALTENTRLKEEIQATLRELALTKSTLEEREAAARAGK